MQVKKDAQKAALEQCTAEGWKAVRGAPSALRVFSLAAQEAAPKAVMTVLERSKWALIICLANPMSAV